MDEQKTVSAAHHLGDESFMSVADLKHYVAAVEAAKASQSSEPVRAPKKPSRS